MAYTDERGQSVESVRMSRMSRDKGQRIEREVLELHRSLGLRAERVPLLGAQRYRGNGADVDVCAFGPEEALATSPVPDIGNGQAKRAASGTTRR